MKAISKVQARDAVAINLKYPKWKHIIPLPPEGLMWSVGGADIENFLVVGDAWAQLVSLYTKLHCRVLDVGCGCGKTARFLSTNRYIQHYLGFDVIPENIQWCRTFIQGGEPDRFSFYHYDLYSREYNPNGQLSPETLQFPCGDQTIDVVVAASLFTHLLEQDARHYLCEMNRVMSRDGKAIVSIHTNTATEEGFQGTEARIDTDPDYFLSICSDSGLELAERVGDVCGQEVFVLRRSDRPWKGWVSNLPVSIQQFFVKRKRG
jgi:SAM-dependent methyltransferase